MSGIEVAGLLLGAIPILLEAVDLYKDGIRKSTTAFRKRRYVEKLTFALLLQKQKLEETVVSVLKASGCRDIWLMDDDPLGQLLKDEVQEQVLDYLGPKNNDAFNGALEQCNNIIKKIAGSMTGLVPSLKGPTDDLLEIIKANREAPVRQLDLLARVKLMFSANELKDFVQELDQTTCALSTFVATVQSNRQIEGDVSSRQATKIAKALRQVRAFAISLYLALCDGWKTGCHSKHEVKLFLEDRVGASADIRRPVGYKTNVPMLIFQLIFTANASESEVLWHETAVQVYHDDHEYHSDNTNSHSTSSKVKISVPKLSSNKPNVTCVEDICGTIETIRCDQRCVAFVLTEKQQVGMIPTDKNIWISHTKPNTTTLKALFLSTSVKSPRSGPILPWKHRMFLALKLSSNLLQLLQTQWLASPWSSDVISFLVRQHVAAKFGSQEQNVDVSRPFISLVFDAATSSHPQQKVEPKVVLLELGILLLEIWHEMTLETRFAITEAVTNYYERQRLATEWFDDMSNPLPELYDRAVSRCIFRTVGGKSRLLDWDDIEFWRGVCADVIEPLLKICKQWP